MRSTQRTREDRAGAGSGRWAAEVKLRSPEKASLSRGCVSRVLEGWALSHKVTREDISGPWVSTGLVAGAVWGGEHELRGPAGPWMLV